MRAGQALKAEMRLHEERRDQVKLGRRLSSLFPAHVRRAAFLTEKLRAKKILTVIIAPPDYTQEQLGFFIREALGRPCRYCGKILTVDNFEIDHKIPLDRGGTFQVCWPASRQKLEPT
jgi:5-methylcytosine-specific restriction endonuclease McrA